MQNPAADEPVVKSEGGPNLLPKQRTILERPLMQFRPFGLDERGRTIRDLSGMSIRATILDLERVLSQQRGMGAGREAVAELCALLNRRIKDAVYHVTPEFLKNPWNSYSYEFAAYLYEFCEQLTGDPRFVFNGGMEKVSPIIQVLARPFSLEQIYGMFPYFGNKFASGSIECRVIEVTSVSATLAMRFTDRTLRQFGPYRRRCTYMVCQSAQGIFAAVPVRVHGLPPATLTNVSCVADDDEWCRWVIRWQPEHPARWYRSRRSKAIFPGLEPSVHPVAVREPGLPASTGSAAVQKASGERNALWDLLWGTDTDGHRAWWIGSAVAGLGLAGVVGALFSQAGVGELALTALLPVLAGSVLITRQLQKDTRRREAVIREQISSVESRHEELREAYLEQEQTRVALRRKVTQLTTLHRAGLMFSSTLDRDAVLSQVLEALTRDLQYDRAMVSVFDATERVIEHVRLIGVPPEIQAFAQSCRITVADPAGPEAVVVLQGRPLLIEDIRTVWHDLHPSNRQLAELMKTKALIVVPLKTKDRIVGMLTVDRTQEHSLTQDDLELMTTVANQVAIALDHAAAYRQIEDWNAGLEAKVRERTAALERADHVRAQFLSHVSHELRTPLTSVKGYIQNLLDGVTGPVTEKQDYYLSRMLDNSDRLLRMIDDLLDRTRIEAGQLELLVGDVDLGACLADAVEQLRPLATAKGQRLVLMPPETAVMVRADRDRLIQVTVNLVQNAIKFTPEYGAVTVRAERSDAYLAKVSVCDTGPGIPPECLEQVFESFFRIRQHQRGGAKGLGLGLSIVKTLVELQGGTVRASNRAGGGAEFQFTVPLVQAADSHPLPACDAHAGTGLSV